MEFLKKISQNDEIFTFGQKMQSLLSVKEILLQFLTELLNSKSLLKQNVAELTKVVKIIERQLKPRLALSSMPFSDVSDALTVAGQLEEKHSASSAASVLWMSVDGMSCPLFCRHIQTVSKADLRTILTLSQDKSIHEVPKFWKHSKYNVFHYGWLREIPSQRPTNSRYTLQSQLRRKQQQRTSSWFQLLIISKGKSEYFLPASKYEE